MTISAFGLSDIGRVRRRNEDGFLVDGAANLYAVADGMGGHAAGDVASQTALAAFAATFADTRSLLASLKSANRAVFERGRTEPGKAGMGTTLTAAHFFGNTIFVGHVGDSRLYRIRRGALDQLTRDHTIAQDHVDRGLMSRLESMRHPLGSMLTRALGLDADVEIDVFEDQIAPGDLYLICSDGLSGMITDEDLAAVLSRPKQLEDIARDLIEAANQRGGTDNITAVLVRV